MLNKIRSFLSNTLITVFHNYIQIVPLSSDTVLYIIKDYRFLNLFSLIDKTFSKNLSSL